VLREWAFAYCFSLTVPTRRASALLARGIQGLSHRPTASRPKGTVVDIRGARPDLHDPDPASVSASEAFSRSVRMGRHGGIACENLHHPGGLNSVSYRASQVQEVVQARHFRVMVPRSGKVLVERICAGA
jgi:hypothetical protein